MAYYLKTVIENYCGTGKLSDDEVDFLEKENIRTIISISKKICLYLANINICNAYNHEPESLWIIFNASILYRIRLVTNGKQRAQTILCTL